MPARTAKQQRWMGMCAHSDHPPEKCPNKKVAREFSFKPAGGYGRPLPLRGDKRRG